jgi:hypothetical protein
MPRGSTTRRSEIVENINAALEIVDDVVQDEDGDLVRAVVAGFALKQIAEGNYEDDREDEDDDRAPEEDEEEPDGEEEPEPEQEQPSQEVTRRRSSRSPAGPEPPPATGASPSSVSTLGARA